MSPAKASGAELGQVLENCLDLLEEAGQRGDTAEAAALKTTIGDLFLGAIELAASLAPDGSKPTVPH